MNIYSAWRWYSGNKIIIRASVAPCSGVVGIPRGVQRKEITPTFQRYLNLDAKRQQIDSFRVKVDLSQGS